MLEDDIKSLYSEYRNCLKSEFSDYLQKDDEYKSFGDKCWQHRKDISNYYHHYYQKNILINPQLEETMDNELAVKYYDYGQYGWTGKQIRN